VPRDIEHTDDMTPELPGPAGHGDLRLLHVCLRLVWGAAALNEHKMPAIRSL
jgi:hypothetical protein